MQGGTRPDSKQLLQVVVPAEVARHKLQVFASLVVISSDMLVGFRSVEQVNLL